MLEATRDRPRFRPYASLARLSLSLLFRFLRLSTIKYMSFARCTVRDYLHDRWIRLRESHVTSRRRQYEKILKILRY